MEKMEGRSSDHAEKKAIALGAGFTIKVQMY